MTLSSVVESYIVHKRSLGMLFNSDAVLLRAYVKAIGDVDIRRIRPADVRRFLYGVGPSHGLLVFEVSLAQPECSMEWSLATLG